MEKKCNICNTTKLLEDFYKNQTRCKSCTKQYAIENKDKIKVRKKKYRQENKEILKENDREYYLKNKARLNKLNIDYYYQNIDEVKKIQKKYRDSNREILCIRNPEYSKKYYIKNKDNPKFILTKNLRSSIASSFKNNGYTKNSKTEVILGCSFEEFRIYIESKFEDWMTWENRGLYNGELNYGWDIDHITPLNSANTEDDIIKLNHYTNLQPLCGYVNRNIKMYKTNFYQ